MSQKANPRAKLTASDLHRTQNIRMENLQRREGNRSSKRHWSNYGLRGPCLCRTMMRYLCRGCLKFINIILKEMEDVLQKGVGYEKRRNFIGISMECL
jgi:hypothetical protein